MRPSRQRPPCRTRSFVRTWAESVPPVHDPGQITSPNGEIQQRYEHGILALRHAGNLSPAPPMNSTAIHTAIPEDAALIAPLFDAYRQFYEQPADADAALAFITARLERGESVILLARRPDGSALGFCQLYPSFCSVLAAPIYVLYDLFVAPDARRSEEHTSELQSPCNLVCRLLLEKKKLLT